VDPRIGTVFAGHRIEQVIGRGGASVVYLAEHLRLGRRVALKVLAPHLAEDEMFRERFIRESRIAAGLDHPNVVTIYDAGEVEDGLYISMRYVEGSDLGKILHAEGALEPPRTILILSQVASGLDAAHAQGLVHRDVKPANVLVEGPGSVLERAYLSDFGISKRTTTGSGLTRTGQFVGTVDYVAPEQITGEPIDGRTDVYSLGCVLFQCLSGRVPFHADTEVATIYRQLNDAPPVVEDFSDTDGLNRVIAKALSKSKEDRYHSCGALIEAARGPLAGSADAPTVVRSRVKRAVPAPAAEPVTDVLAEPNRGGRSRGRIVWWSAAVVVATAGIVGAVLLSGGRESPGATDPGAETGGGPTGSSSTTTSQPPPDALRLAWSLIKEPNFAGDQAMYDVAATRDGLAAVGHVEGASAFDHDGAVWFSSDTDRWERSDSESLGGAGDQRLLAVAEFMSQGEGNPEGATLVAGGWDDLVPAIWSSTDAGGSWTRSSSDDLATPGGEIRDLVTFGGSTLVAVGGSGPRLDQDAAVWTSADGFDWIMIDDEDLLAPGDQQIWSVHNADGRLIAVGYTTEGGSYDAAVWTSENGTDWSRVDPTVFAETGQQLMKAVAGGTDGIPLVAVGCENDYPRCDLEGEESDAAVWVSDDGETWEAVELLRNGVVGSGIQTMIGLTRQGRTFVASGTATAGTGDLDAAVWTSSDGRSWNPRLSPRAFIAALGGPPDDQTIRAVIPFHRKGFSFIAVGVTDDGTDQDTAVWGGS
jgi:tRNA A-37 threonylcarbamoyl transferase component Bud32